MTLAKSVGEMRTETELLPQCWEQVSFAVYFVGDTICTFCVYFEGIFIFSI